MKCEEVERKKQSILRQPFLFHAPFLRATLQT